ncbi:hypothetical protein SD81_030675 [Tolypothrix campylonemoides VB511288]|nr:hypothetical protein SD81_030675 [Tolypothrix campylonemoides VB511288]
MSNEPQRARRTQRKKEEVKKIWRSLTKKWYYPYLEAEDINACLKYAAFLASEGSKHKTFCVGT